MRTWIIGIILFIGWATFSAYHYVCKIKGMCETESQASIHEVVEAEDLDAVATVAPKKIEFERPDIHFKNGTDQIVENSALVGAALKLRALAKAQDIRISLEGHTDNSGGTDFNYQLGLKRAQALKNYLTRNGIAPEIMEVKSFGESRPLALNNSAENRAKNRRVEIILHQIK